MRTPFAGFPILVAACQDDPQFAETPAATMMYDRAEACAQVDDIKHSADVSAQMVSLRNQGVSDADIAITFSVRRFLAMDKHQSAEAPNITIITRDGFVTLRGLVKSSFEKTRITAAAEMIAGSHHIIDELIIIDH